MSRFGREQKFWNVRVNDEGRAFRDRVKTRNRQRPFHNVHVGMEGDSPRFDRLIDMVFKPPFGIQQAYIIPYRLAEAYASPKGKGCHLYINKDLIAEPGVQDITERVDWV